MLNGQLRELGLYAAHTIGDGNCLFRALSDQLYGTPSQHLKLRVDICNWIEDHKERYAPFVEDERGLDHHLSCMRQQGACMRFPDLVSKLMPVLATYGGHLELSAFAHMTKRNVKVIQPGLVYVIEWDAGGDLGDSSAQGDDDPNLDDREKRRLRRERRRSEQAAVDDAEPSMTTGTVYVAYVSPPVLRTPLVNCGVATMTGSTFPLSGISVVRTSVYLMSRRPPRRMCRFPPPLYRRSQSRRRKRRLRGRPSGNPRRLSFQLSSRKKIQPLSLLPRSLCLVQSHRHRHRLLPRHLKPPASTHCYP